MTPMQQAAVRAACADLIAAVRGYLPEASETVWELADTLYIAERTLDLTRDGDWWREPSTGPVSAGKRDEHACHDL